MINIYYSLAETTAAAIGPLWRVETSKNGLQGQNEGVIMGNIGGGYGVGYGDMVW